MEWLTLFKTNISLPSVLEQAELPPFAKKKITNPEIKAAWSLIAHNDDKEMFTHSQLCLVEISVVTRRGSLNVTWTQKCCHCFKASCVCFFHRITSKTAR